MRALCVQKARVFARERCVKSGAQIRALARRSHLMGLLFFLLRIVLFGGHRFSILVRVAQGL
jgi:hypothetical protein